MHNKHISYLHFSIIKIYEWKTRTEFLFRITKVSFNFVSNQFFISLPDKGMMPRHIIDKIV